MPSNEETIIPEEALGDVLGIVEVAALLEVQPRTPRMWLFRELMPEAEYLSVNGQRAWKRRSILKWAAKTGRLPESGSRAEEAKRYLPKTKAAK
jgi:hypothetical protein